MSQWIKQMAFARVWICMRKMMCDCRCQPPTIQTVPTFYRLQNVPTTWCRSTNYTQTFSHSVSRMPWTRTNRYDGRFSINAIRRTPQQITKFQHEYFNWILKANNFQLKCENWWHIDAESCIVAGRVANFFQCDMGISERGARMNGKHDVDICIKFLFARFIKWLAATPSDDAWLETLNWNWIYGFLNMRLKQY